MNIAEILNDCPTGTKLYSTVHGEVSFLYINKNDIYSIVTNSSRGFAVFASDGRINVKYNGECTLFPSKDNRDWSTFKVPKKEYNFKPFDKVLVRDSYNDVWQIDLFSWIDHISDYKYQAMTNAWQQCIPYEGNEHLLGTTKNPN